MVQLLLAVASGAHLMTPAWVTASLEAGHWLSEQPFLSKVSLLALLHITLPIYPIRYGRQVGGNRLCILSTSTE